MDTAINKAITEADELQARYQARAAIRRLEERFAETYAANDLDASRALIEKVHLICGNRRFKHISVQVNRRQS